ncbi:hypothetical protein CMK19_02375 [Candidatus Poribacteria bacterium]|nr:hypothetical protein [Candidatus Poribacteria bacterium]MEE2911709.1 Gfo/Idh/MocA family oxidoreductase [Candidatus Poribacteria bacterium]|tara:strand:+ start:3834 stop:4994 length:1161 start_codon:yes stop_codon:yes gene_type:complete
MKNEFYRVAILGCRSRGRAAALAYHDHPRTKIVGLCDLIQDRLTELGNELSITAQYTNLGRMIEETKPDIVVIATGTEFHYDLCMQVLEYGVHIEVEKPMCVDLVQADEVISKAELKKCKIAVHHQGRVGPAMLALQKAIDQEKIGEIRYLYGSGKGYYGGYGLMNIGTHMINNMLRFTHQCQSVVAHTTTNGRSIETKDVLASPSGMGTITGEYISASFQFSSNVTGTLLQHRFDKMDTSAYVMEIYGSEGRLFWRSNQAWWLPQPHYVPGMKWEPLDPIFPKCYQPGNLSDADDFSFVDEYVRALDNDDQHECSGYQGRHVLEIMMGIFESSTDGTRVNLPQVDRQHPLLRWSADSSSNEKSGNLESLPRDYPSWLSKLGINSF